MNQDKRKPTSAEAQREAKKPEPTPAALSLPVETQTPKPNGGTSENQGYGKHKSSLATRIEAGCAVALVVITGFYTHYASQQACAAIKAAEAAKRSADISASVMVITERALVSWIGSSEGDLKTWANFGVIWENLGNLPTNKLSDYIDYALLDSDLPSDFEFPDTHEPIVTGTVVFPKQKIFSPHIPKDGTIKAADLTKIRDGTKKLYVFGWARYFDGFPTTPQRVTEFCYRARFTKDPEHPFMYEPCPRHNCVDDGCSQEQDKKQTK